MKNNVKIVITILVIVGIFLAAILFGGKKSVSQTETPANPTNVSVQSAKDSTQLKAKVEYPATIVGDQEVKITAKSAGNIAQASFELGAFVSQGSLLAKIDDTGNALSAGDNGFKSSQVQQSDYAKEQAKESLDAAKKYYKDLKKAHDDGGANAPTKAQVNSAKDQIDIAEAQYGSAKVGFSGTLDDHLITSPISGFVTGKTVSVGDSVSVGQEIATISKTQNVKAQFFVDQNQLASFSKGMEVDLSSSGGDSAKAVVRNISPAADPTTKRFLIEAFPVSGVSKIFASGTVATVSFETVDTPNQGGNLILPLSAITISQNESHIFIDDNGLAKKVNVTIIRVSGEAAEIKADIPSDAKIIMNGSKLVKDGERITVQN